MPRKKRMKVNPRTGRKTVYLGHRVRDTRRAGLDTLREVEDICKAIIRDYRSGKINKKTANGRFSRLYNAIIPRSKGLVGKKRQAKKIVRRYWDKLVAM